MGNDSLPRRVVLIVKSEKDDADITKAFLNHVNRPEQEYEDNIHWTHLDPDRCGAESWSRIIIDLNAKLWPSHNLDDISYDIYKVTHIEGQEVLKFKYYDHKTYQQYYDEVKDRAKLLRWGR